MLRPLMALCLAILVCCAACASTAGGAVASPEPYAAAAGARILGEGGNAMDAAACMGFVLAVTHPAAGNLGGGGFLVVHGLEGDITIDARETAPRAAHRDMYLDEAGNPLRDASLVGPLAAGVPGSVAGYLLLMEKHGTLPRHRILEPAIRLAEEGFRVDRGLHESFDRSRELLEKFPETSRIFMPDGDVLRAGDILRQPQLAKVLRAISERGKEGFYEGWVAQRIEETAARHGGRITVADMAEYSAKVREPIRGMFKGYDVITMPPPSSGGVVLLQMLGMLDRSEGAYLRHAQRVHLFSEVGRRAFADRARYFGDPDFVEVPVGELLDPEYLQKRFASVDMARATPSTEVDGGLGGQLTESDATCHFSVVDRFGNAVACTTTLNGSFGCGLAAAGVLLNNEMDDFTVKPGEPNLYGLVQSEKNAIEPGKRPLSSMTPTILLKNGRVRLVLGSPGGPTIISSVCVVIARHIVVDMDLREAVAAPRFHHQWLPDEIVYEELDSEDVSILEKLGHALRKRERPMGDVQAIAVDGSGRAVAVSDPRGRGEARASKRQKRLGE
ncbi:MAG: gamma-glutamyltransferase [Planctomycetota bacterium]|jgi:gamma-glutamyltranspeptidase/glutathione hydrolase